jgi:hypothetical protein
MDKLLLIDRTTWALSRVSLAEAAQRMGVEPDHILWAIEEYGRCDVDQLIAIKEEYLP